MEGQKVLIYGLESDATFPLSKVLNIHGSMSITRGENKTDDTHLAYMPPDKFSISTEFDLNPLSVSVLLKHVLPQTRLGEFETKTEGYSRVDIVSTYQFHSSHLMHKIIFGIENVFNSEYYNHLSRIK